MPGVVGLSQQVNMLLAFGDVAGPGGVVLVIVLLLMVIVLSTCYHLLLQINIHYQSLVMRMKVI
jgi:hypothetical protein